MRSTAYKKVNCRGRRVLALAWAVWLCVALYGVACASDDEIIGSVGQFISAGEPDWQESPLGDLTADALRETLNCDISLVPASLLTGHLPGGELTRDYIAAAYGSDPEIRIVTMTVAQLRAVLEQSLSHITVGYGDMTDPELSRSPDFLQISGFRVVYDASAPAGQRLYELRFADGVTREDDAELLAAVPTGLWKVWEAGLDWDGCLSNRTLTDCVADYFTAKGTVSEPEGRRILSIGTNDRTLFEAYVPAWLLVPATALIAVSHFLWKRHNSADDY